VDCLVPVTGEFKSKDLISNPQAPHSQMSLNSSQTGQQDPVQGRTASAGALASEPPRHSQSARVHTDFFNFVRIFFFRFFFSQSMSGLKGKNNFCSVSIMEMRKTLFVWCRLLLQVFPSFVFEQTRVALLC